jgi:glycolate oxidase FAD binding subunit
MRRDRDDSDRIQSVVKEAYRTGTVLAIVGAGTKTFVTAQHQGSLLSIADHVGILDYKPDELVLTARAGTPLAELERALAAHGQMLPFDPPLFADGGTIGGAIACGLSGPARPWRGAVRDAVLGAEIVDGQGRRLRFGGQVMKNVAGYDVSRLMVGAFGTLGVLLAVSVRVLPRPEAETTVVQFAERERALERVVELGRTAEPVTATCHVDGKLHVRFGGAARAVHNAAQRFGGERAPFADDFWRAVRDQRHEFFRKSDVWRLSLPFAARYPDIDGEWLTEWGGAQRWCATDAEPSQVLIACRKAGGHASGRRGAMPMFPMLDSASMRYHARLKHVFDPARILNRGRMYTEL